MFSDPSGADAFSDSWNANTSYLNSTLGSSSSWGVSDTASYGNYGAPGVGNAEDDHSGIWYGSSDSFQNKIFIPGYVIQDGDNGSHLDTVVPDRWVKDKNKSPYPKFKDVIKNERYLVTGISKIHSSKYANILRKGGNTAANASCVRGLKIFGSALSVVTVGIEFNQYLNDEMSGLEFLVDTAVAGAVIYTTYAAVGAVTVFAGVTVGTVVVAAAIVFAVGKVGYEAYTGKPLFDKP